MQTLLSDLQSWYAAQCDDDWEHSFGIEIITLDNPGWRLTVDLRGTLLENKIFSRIEHKGVDDKWIECSVKDNKFVGGAGSHQLGELISTFLTWAKSEPDWLAVTYEATAERKKRTDQELWNRLGEENGSSSCRKAGCSHKHIAHSAFCRKHHFEMIRGYSPPETLL